MKPINLTEAEVKKLNRGEWVWAMDVEEDKVR
jgi:hypothetical protein